MYRPNQDKMAPTISPYPRWKSGYFLTIKVYLLKLVDTASANDENILVSEGIWKKITSIACFRRPEAATHQVLLASVEDAMHQV